MRRLALPGSPGACLAHREWPKFRARETPAPMIFLIASSTTAIAVVVDILEQSECNRCRATASLQSHRRRDRYLPRATDGFNDLLGTMESRPALAKGGSPIIRGGDVPPPPHLKAYGGFGTRSITHSFSTTSALSLSSVDTISKHLSSLIGALTYR